MEVLPNGDGTTIAQGHDVLMSATTEVHPTYTTALPTAAYSIPRSIAAAAPTSTNALKRARSRSVRGGPSNKRVVSSNAKLPNDPKEEEEMERKIQDIVAKALEVDSAAKCAEKERRARGEKRKEKTTSAASVVSGMRRTDDFSGVQGRAPNVTSIPEGVSGPIMSPTRAFDGGTVTVPPAALMTTAELESARSDED